MSPHSFFFFFFNDTATTEIYTLSLHDALPILLSALQTALFELGLKPHQVVVISGIGCSSNLPGFINTYGMHTLHGRALAVGVGVKMGNHELKVICVGGDGDGYGIGGNHFVATNPRNVALP